MKKTVLQLHLPRTAPLLKGLAVLLALQCINHNLFAQADTVKKLEEVNIRSSLLPLPQTATPSQTVTNVEFLHYSAFNVADAIRNFAGVNVRDYGGIGGLKTVSVRSLGANHTIVLYDGVQINDAQNGQIDLSKFNLYNIREISLYIPQSNEICMPARSFSAGSVLSIKTIQPELTVEKPFKILAGIKGGSFGLVNPYLQWQQRLSDKWSFIVNTYKQDANGQYYFRSSNLGKDTTGTRLNGDVDAGQFDGALYWSRSDSNRFHIQFNYNNMRRGLPGAVVEGAQYLNQRLHNRDIFAQAGYERIWDNSLHLLVNTKLSHNYQHYTDKDFLNDKGGSDDEYTQKELYQSAAVSYSPLNGLEVSYASDVSYTTVNSNAALYAVPTRLWLLNNLSAKYIAGRLTLQGNVLSTYIHDELEKGEAPPSASKLSPAFIVTYTPFTSNFQLRAFYKDIFRYPTLSDRYYYTPQPRDVEPEYVKQYNLGATYAKYLNGLVNYIGFTADAYYNDVTNKIIYLPGRSAEVSSVRNLGRVDIRGLDVSVKSQLRPSYNLTCNLSAAYTFQKAVDVTDPDDSYYLSQIPYTPQHSFNINAGTLYKGFGFNYNLSLSSSRYLTSDNTADNYVAPYAISDVSAVYNFKISGKPLVASAEFNNLFSKQYEVVRFYPMPLASFRFTLQITI